MCGTYFLHTEWELKLIFCFYLGKYCSIILFYYSVSQTEEPKKNLKIGGAKTVPCVEYVNIANQLIFETDMSVATLWK